MQAKVQIDINRYAGCREALAKLAVPLVEVGWELQLPPICEGDARQLEVGTGNNTTEGRRTLSWIWKTQGMGEGSEGMQEGQSILCSVVVLHINQSP